MPAHATVLVIEDDDAIRDFIVEVLDDEGYCVHGVPDIQTGKIALADQRIDLILCDYHLPDASGLAFARSLQDSGSTVPIVLMTADSRPPAHSDRAAIAFCLLKPFTLTQLLDCVAAHLRARRCG